MALTAVNWQAAMRNATAEPLAHVEIELDSDTFTFCTGNEYVNGATPSLTEVTSLSQAVNPKDRKPQVGSISLMFTADGAMRELVKDFKMKGKRCTVLLGEKSLTSTADYLPVFRGTISEVIPGDDNITLEVEDVFGLLRDTEITGFWINKHPLTIIEELLRAPGISTELYDADALDPDNYPDTISHWNTTRAKHGNASRIIYEPTSCFELMGEIGVLLNGGLVPQEDGKLAFLMYDQTNTEEAHWTVDDVRGFEQNSTFQNMINEVTVDFYWKGSHLFGDAESREEKRQEHADAAEYRLHFTYINLDSQTGYAYPGTDTFRSEMNIQTKWLGCQTFAYNELGTGTDLDLICKHGHVSSFCGTRDFEDPSATEATLSATRRAYLLVGQEIVACDSVVVDTELEAFTPGSTGGMDSNLDNPGEANDENEWVHGGGAGTEVNGGMDGDGRHDGSKSPYQFGVTPPGSYVAIARATFNVSERGLFGTLECAHPSPSHVYDITIAVEMALARLARFSNGNVTAKIFTNLSQSYLQVGDMVTIDNDVFLKFGASTTDSTRKWEIISKEVLIQGDNQTVAWTLSEAPAATAYAAHGWCGTRKEWNPFTADSGVEEDGTFDGGVDFGPSDDSSCAYQPYVVGAITGYATGSPGDTTSSFLCSSVSTRATDIVFNAGSTISVSGSNGIQVDTGVTDLDDETQYNFYWDAEWNGFVAEKVTLGSLFDTDQMVVPLAQVNVGTGSITSIVDKRQLTGFIGNQIFGFPGFLSDTFADMNLGPAGFYYDSTNNLFYMSALGMNSYTEEVIDQAATILWQMDETSLAGGGTVDSTGASGAGGDGVATTPPPTANETGLLIDSGSVLDKSFQFNPYAGGDAEEGVNTIVFSFSSLIFGCSFSFLMQAENASGGERCTMFSVSFQTGPATPDPCIFLATQGTGGSGKIVVGYNETEYEFENSTTGVDLQDQEPHHVVLTIPGSVTSDKFCVYVDGKLVAAQVPDSYMPVSILTNGKIGVGNLIAWNGATYPADDTKSFHGYIDQFAFWVANQITPAQVVSQWLKTGIGFAGGASFSPVVFNPETFNLLSPNLDQINDSQDYTKIDYELPDIVQTDFADTLNEGFRAYPEAPGPQTIDTATMTVVEFDTEIWDTGGVYDSSTTFRFSPDTSGKFMVSAQASWGTIPDDGSLLLLILRVNGLEADPMTIYGPSVVQNGATHPGTPTVSGVMDLSDSDFVEVCVYHDSAGSETLVGGSALTWFYAYKVFGDYSGT